jgi:hypothetical protein
MRSRPTERERPLFQCRVSWAHSVRASGFAILGALIGLPLAITSPGDPGEQITGVVLLVTASFGVWHALRDAEVQVFEDRVVIADVHGSLILSRASIDHFLSERTLAVMFPCKSLFVAMKDGNVVETNFATYARRGGKTTIVDRVCSDLNGWLAPRGKMGTG